MKMAVCKVMCKFPHELADIPEDSYLAVALALKGEADEIQKQIEEAKNNVEK
jgi:hypothetical protein